VGSRGKQPDDLMLRKKNQPTRGREELGQAAGVSKGEQPGKAAGRFDASSRGMQPG